MIFVLVPTYLVSFRSDSDLNIFSAVVFLTS